MARHQDTHLPTTTVHQARLQLYEPTRRPEDYIREIETSRGGKARVEGKLGQAHADFVESVLRYAEAWDEDDEGRLHVRVDPYKIRMSIGGGKQASHDQMWKVAREVMRALIGLTFDLQGTTVRVEGHIIDTIKESKKRVRDPLLVSGGAKDSGRALWEVTFGASYVRLLSKDWRRDYDPLPIARLSKGVSQAIARLVFTHRDDPVGGWLVDTLIEAVGAQGCTKYSMRDRRRDLRCDATSLAAIGILLDGDRLHRLRRGAFGPERGANARERGANAR